MLTLCQYLHHTCCTNLCLYTSSSSSSWTSLSYHGLTSPCFCLTSHVLVKIKVSPCNSSSSLSSAASSLPSRLKQKRWGKIQSAALQPWTVADFSPLLPASGGRRLFRLWHHGGRKSFGSGCDSASIIFLHYITSHSFNRCSFFQGNLQSVHSSNYSFYLVRFDCF